MHKIVENNGKAITAFLLAAATSMSCMLGANAAQTYTIEAPNGVGDVVALTNALTQLNALSSRDNARVWLEPGLYDLRGVFMDSENHLRLDSASGAMIAGLGDGPDKTILLGGGDDSEKGRHRILKVGGTNYGFTSVSNLTVTGGYTTGNGGGIEGSSTVKYYNLVVSNNYAKGSNNGAGGGGCASGKAYNCLFADNSTEMWGGGFWTNGGCGQISDVQGAWDCVFSNNYISASGRYGGGLKLGGKCVRCKFVGNRAPNAGALYVYATEGRYTWLSGKYTNTTEILDCVFEGNHLTAWGNGSAVQIAAGVTISNCVFAANVDTQGGDGMIYGGDLYDCVITNNFRITSLLYNCNLVRCLVSSNSVSGNAGLIDGETTAGVHTNVNCLFVNNVMTSYGRISNSKAFVNCTIVGNDSQNGGNYGFICTPSCNLINCVLSGNRIGGSMLDIRPIYNPGGTTTSALHMVSCVFVKSQSGVGEDWEGLVNCKKVADVRFVDAANGDYTPKTRSAAYDAGCQDPWILSLVGATDLAGNDRVFGGRIDIGAYESQVRKPGAMFIFR